MITSISITFNLTVPFFPIKSNSQVAPSFQRIEIIQPHNNPLFTVQTLHSGVDCLFTLEDEHAPHSSVHLVVDVPDKDCDTVDIKNSSRVIAYNILHEILSLMPAKSAIKFSTSLYKGLCNIHLEPRFIKKQCIRSCGQDNGIFLQHKNVKSKNDRISNKFEFHVLPWETGPAFGMPLESLDFLPKSGHILSSSNGILLLYDPSPTGGCVFKVCNPAIRQWAPLPIPGGMGIVDENFSPLIECYPWGHGVLDNVEFPNDYTIALPVSFSMCWRMQDGKMVRIHKQELLIYSLGRWEKELCEVAIVGRLARFDMPVGIFSKSTKGLIVHYMCDNGPRGMLFYPDYMEPYIAAVNIREKKLLREIKLPDGAWDVDIAKLYGPSEKKLLIFKWNETSICLLRWWPGHSKITAWVLDDYGCEEESWKLVMDASERELCPDGCHIMSMGVAGGGKGLLIATAPAKHKKGSSTGVEASQSAHSGADMFSRVYVYVLEGKNQGRLELVGEHHFGFKGDFAVDALKFLPYANTLRPVSVQNSKTHNY